MEQISKRLGALSTAQRELLARRLQKSLGAQADGERTTVAPTPTTARADVSPVAETRGELQAPRGELFDRQASDGQEARSPARRAEMQFSLFFFSDDGSKCSDDKYRLLFECARYADEHGFAAVWTPERHFQDFGGLYPNPSVLSAALAMVTRNVGIRAGSVALPLHHPIRVAEEWSLVDNLSKGRVGVSFASGWHRDDFVFSPAAHEHRRDIMFQHIKTIQRLWAGETVTFDGVDAAPTELRILPRPVQPKLPIWVTSSGHPETWVRAGEVGANILTGIQVEPSALAEKIRVYRASLARHGHDPEAGQVTVMLHTYLGADLDAVRECVRAPLTAYLRTFMAQGKHLDAAELGLDPQRLTEADRETLARFAFERFFDDKSLLGTPEKCAPYVERLRAAGVDEIACLVDFGLELEAVLEGLEHLQTLRQRFSASPATSATAAISSTSATSVIPADDAASPTAADRAQLA